MSTRPAAVCAAVVGIVYGTKALDNRAPSRRYLKPGFGCFAVAAEGGLCAFCRLVDALSEQCLRRKPGVNPFSLLFLEPSRYFVNAVKLHVTAADVLVKRGVDGEGFR